MKVNSASGDELKDVARRMALCRQKNRDDHDTVVKRETICLENENQRWFHVM